tara:strand:- start:55 stop:669 length:615 start_codon:yes stop_codon:yes gene_type:complete
MQPLNITEIFYSLQGEGYRVGVPSIFIRLSGCSAKNACFKSGVMCDTDFLGGKIMDVSEILEEIRKYPCKEIVWTGGEPTDQLTDEHIKYFRENDYYNAIECSGIRQPSRLLDWIVISPKVAEHVILKKFKTDDDGFHCDELRWVRHKGQNLPDTKIKAIKYYISPHTDGDNINYENLDWCINLCLEDPKWNLSLQQHKVWRVR